MKKTHSIDASRTEQIIGGTLTSLLTLLIVILHVPIVYVVLTRRNCKTSFFKICAARSIGHLIASLTVGISCALALFLNKQFLMYLINGYYFTLNFLFCSELLISLNRFVAVFYWQFSAKIFTEMKTMACIIIIILVTICRAFFSVYDGCYATYYHHNMSMVFDEEECSKEVILLGFMELLMFMGFILNLVTLYKLISLHKRGIGQDHVANNRLRQNITHFTFTFTQSVIWMIVGCTIIVRSYMFPDHKLIHYIFEDLVEFVGSIAEGILFWILHGHNIISRQSFSNGNSRAANSNSRVVLTKGTITSRKMSTR